MRAQVHCLRFFKDSVVLHPRAKAPPRVMWNHYIKVKKTVPYCTLLKLEVCLESQQNDLLLKTREKLKKNLHCLAVRTEIRTGNFFILPTQQPKDFLALILRQ